MVAVAQPKQEGCGRSPCATYRGRTCLICADSGLLDEWDHERNDRDPAEVTPKSSHKAHWICSEGHQWQAPVYNRTQGRGCRQCLGIVATPERNLTVLHPDLAEEWDFERNDRDPSTITPGSTYKAHWICKNGHRWQSTVNHRTPGIGCHKCTGRVPTPERNLKALHPDLAKEWDFERNDKDPSEFTPGSEHKAHWICSKGHRWQAPILSRTQGRGCARCVGKTPTPERNLAILHPDLVKEWDFKRNDKDPSGFTPGSSYKVYWNCSRGHRWLAQIAKRTGGRGCPGCARTSWRLVLPGLVYTLGLPKTVPPESEVIIEARRQGFPDRFVGALLDAIRLLKTGTFTEDDFARYAAGDASPLAKFLSGSEAHRRAIKEGWISVEASRETV